MVYEERQSPKKINGEWTQKVYIYNDDKVGHPIDQRLDTLTEVEALALLPKPEAVNIDPMNLLKALTDAEFTEVAALINASPVVAGFFTRPSINLDATTANRMQSMIDSAGLTKGTTATLTGLIAGLKAKMKV